MGGDGFRILLEEDAIKLKNKNRSFLIEIDPMIQIFDRKRRKFEVYDYQFWSKTCIFENLFSNARVNFGRKWPIFNLIKSHTWCRWEIGTVMSNLTVNSWHISGHESLLNYGPIICIYRRINPLCKKVCPFLYMSFILRFIKVKAEQHSHQTPLKVSEVNSLSSGCFSDKIKGIQKEDPQSRRTFVYW